MQVIGGPVQPGPAPPTPLLLVGHPLGGLNMQLFARLYPKEVVGVVLVDATPVDLLDRFAEVLREEQLRAVFPGPERHPERCDIRAALAEIADAPRFPNVPLIVLGRTVFPPDVPRFPGEEPRPQARQGLRRHKPRSRAEGRVRDTGKDRPSCPGQIW